MSRARWSSREASRVLLGLLLEAFAPKGPLVLGVDETLERRKGKKIVAKGIYRDPVRSSHEHFVKTSALRWVCLTLLVRIPWASRVWASNLDAPMFVNKARETISTLSRRLLCSSIYAELGRPSPGAKTRAGRRDELPDRLLWRCSVLGTA